MPVIFQKTLFLPHKVIIPGNKMCLDTFSPDIRVNFLLAPFIVVASLFLTVFFSGFATASPELLKAARQVDMSGVQTQLTRDAGANPIPYPQILASAASSGDAKLVNRLITMGMDPNAKNEHGLALLQAACAYQGSNKKIQAELNAAIEVLLEAGSDVNSSAHGR